MTPIRLAIELDRLRAVTNPDELYREVGELVERIIAMRVAPPTEVVWIRARDVHDLARRWGTTRMQFALWLRELGVTAAIDVATRDKPGPARQDRDTHSVGVLTPPASPRDIAPMFTQRLPDATSASTRHKDIRKADHDGD